MSRPRILVRTDTMEVLTSGFIQADFFMRARVGGEIAPVKAREIHPATMTVLLTVAMQGHADDYREAEHVGGGIAQAAVWNDIIDPSGRVVDHDRLESLAREYLAARAARRLGSLVASTSAA